MSGNNEDTTAAVGLGNDSGGRGTARRAPSSSSEGLGEGLAGPSFNMATANIDRDVMGVDGRDVRRMLSGGSEHRYPGSEHLDFVTTSEMALPTSSPSPSPLGARREGRKRNMMSSPSSQEGTGLAAAEDVTRRLDLEGGALGSMSVSDEDLPSGGVTNSQRILRVRRPPKIKKVKRSPLKLSLSPSSRKDSGRTVLD